MHVSNSTVIQLHQPIIPHSDFYSFRDCTTRQQAIDEGYLVDISAYTTTFNVPVAMTREVWEYCVAINQADSFKEKTRVISILMQAKLAIKSAKPHLSEVVFEVKRFPRNIRSCLNKQRLWITVSQGDHYKPVLTIMLDTQQAEAS